MFRTTDLLRATLLATSTLAPVAAGAASFPGTSELPTGLAITPLALGGATQQMLNPRLSAYPGFVASEALRELVSPDGKTLVVLTGGENSLYNSAGSTDTANSTQYLFFYDISSSSRAPVLTQVVKQTNANRGLVFSPDGGTLFAAGGNDDAVYAYTNTAGVWAQSAKIALGHLGGSLPGGVGLLVEPETIGLAITADGATLLAANNYNDSVSVIDVASRKVRAEYDLRPFNTSNQPGVAGGEFPFDIKINGTTAYVSSTRDREIVVLDISGASPRLVKRIALAGNPYGMTIGAGSLFVAEDNQDKVGQVDLLTNSLVREIDVRAPAVLMPGVHYTGVAPYSVAVSPNGLTLNVVNSGADDIAVVPLAGPLAYRTTALVPTAYAPKDLAFSADGKRIYIVNGKSNTGPNPAHLMSNTASIKYEAFGPIPPGGTIATANAAAAVTARAANQYQFQLEQGSIVSAPTPNAASLVGLTLVAADDNNYLTPESQSDTQTMAFLHQRIKHIIYIVKENRTFDQMLGDLTNGANADPALVQFGQSITPNFHQMANQFVTLDNFYDPADGSMDGWSWTMRGRITNDEEVTQQQNYASVDRGVSYEAEGSNRNVPVGVPVSSRVNAVAPETVGGVLYNYNTLSALVPGGTANLLPGPTDIAATDTVYNDGSGEQEGYIFTAALKAGLSVRNYGFMVNNIGPTTTSVNGVATPITNAGAQGIVQVAALQPQLIPYTDTYFRGFDQTYSDQWTTNEWQREFNQYVQNGNLPNFETLRLSHDHTGSFSTALGGVNTPEAQEADNDLAVGRVLQAVANSPYANSTLVFIIEDDSQDGPDHVDSHRATTYVVGAYVKQHAVVDTRYNQVNLLRTMEDIMGTSHVSLQTAHAEPMGDVFDTSLSGNWMFTPVASTILSTTSLNLAMNEIGIRYAGGPVVRPSHSAAWWAAQTKGYDFSVEDRIPFDAYNRVMWKGIKGTPYPSNMVTATADHDDD